jgi:rhodanese-related sulfurtransferase
MVLLDVRTAQEYREGHLPKSMNIDWLQSSFATKAAKLPKNQPFMCIADQVNEVHQRQNG